MSPQLKAALISFARVFVAAVLAQYLTLGKGPFDLNAQDLEVVISAGVAALALVIFNAVNPKDARYGYGAPDPQSGGDVASTTL